jgi:hypothetical protein
MNITQRQEILDLIEKLDKFDMLGFLKAQGIDNIETYQYNDRVYSEFSTQFSRMNLQLKAEVNGRDYKFLPMIFNSNTEFGNINLTQDLNELLSSIKIHGNEGGVVRTLDRLIFYQVAFGFWDRSSVNVHDSRTIDIKRKLSELSVLEEKFKTQHEKIEKDLTTVNDLSTQLKDGLTQISSNSGQIVVTKQESDAFVLEIKRNLDDANVTKTQINALETTITEASNKIKSDINENSKKFNEIEIQNKALQDELMKSVEVALEDQKNIRNTHTYIDSQRDQIAKMVGLATDGAIGYKFDERQKSIFKSSWFWKIAVPVSYIIAAIWIVIVFSILKSKMDNEWLNLVINSLKTTPVWFLVAFCTNQYKKEREFEEEYAFKSAVAMTITSYTSLLSNDDVNNMKTKDQVLSKVLDNLYASPLKKEMERKSVFRARKKVVSDMASKSKELEEILRPVIELMKEIKK